MTTVAFVILGALGLVALYGIYDTTRELRKGKSSSHDSHCHCKGICERPGQIGCAGNLPSADQGEIR